jgi:prepilin-type N-terminal cleavage/methylation domain-containing protein
MTNIDIYIMKLFSAQKGFTLIELLVVIGILGILAAALVATIDPFEQLKKANDANSKNAMVEYLNANIRYYTTHSEFPWDDSVDYAACYNGGTVPASSALDNAQMTNCIEALTDENELKQAFDSSPVLQNIYITYTAGTNELTGCFQPESKSQQADVNTKFDRDGTENAVKNCASTAATNGCYWCTK